MITNQGILFLIYVISGIIIGLIFDLFRSLRKSIKTSNIVTYIEDILFWVIVGFIITGTILKFNYGELRLYIFIGLLFGGVAYFLTLSKLFIKCTTSCFKFMFKIFDKIKNIIEKIFGKPIRFIIINLRKIPKIYKREKKVKKDKNLSKLYK